MRNLFFVLILLPVVAFGKDKVPVDKNCEKMSDVAEGFAKLRDAGYSVGEVNSFTTEPTVQTFPIQSVKRYVYSITDKGAEDIRQQLSGLCNNIGFDMMNRFLVQDEESQKSKALIEALQSQNQTLQFEVEELKQSAAVKKTPLKK